MIVISVNNIMWKSPPYGKLRTGCDYNGSYLNEPHVNGGSPIVSNGNVMLNDMLGTTVGSSQDGVYSTTAFGVLLFNDSYF